MIIELKNLKTLASLSEETHCYTATIYVDGKPAFQASNRGHGGCDDYRPIAPFTYDVVVTAALTYLAAEHGFEVSSDGEAEDWEAGRKLATLALGKAFPNPRAEKVA